MGEREITLHIAARCRTPARVERPPSAEPKNGIQTSPHWKEGKESDENRCVGALWVRGEGFRLVLDRGGKVYI